jgi:hypothetical protein
MTGLTTNHPFTEEVPDSSIASVATGQIGNLRAPFRGKLIEFGTILGSATTTADATVTVSIAGTNVTGGSYVITQSGSAAGNLSFCSTSGKGNNGATAGSTITGANTCNEGDVITATMSGSGTGGGTLYCYAVIAKA